VENLIGFTNGLHIEAIAEGVETEEQAQRLHGAGYRLAQGYLFGRPMPAEDVERQLSLPAVVVGA
jgi:EAL domain-containing protein (putative c-di-GMP-specific phosphodiesterase class I)